MENQKQRLFVDMDGTLAVFRTVDTMEKLYEKEYFSRLEPNKNVVLAVNHLILTHPEIEINVLSAYLADSPYALREKNEWLNKHLPLIPDTNRLFVPCGTEKRHAVPQGIKENDYLLDDYTKNLMEWEPAGKGIKLLNGINHTHGTWQGDRIDYNRPPHQLAELMVEIMKGNCHIYDLQANKLPKEQKINEAETEEYLQNADKPLFF